MSQEDKKVKRIAVIGLGLIGGSLARALKINSYRIVGISRNKDTVEKALVDKVIDEGYLEVSTETLKEVDITFLTPPLDLIPHYIQCVGDVVKHEMILTDGGSTKQEICEVAKKILPENISFVGGHPMAGTEKAGYTASDISLFKQCAWILTPNDNSEKTKNAIKTLQEIILEIGAKPIIANPEKHDKAVSLVSHIPLLTSISLCQLVRNLNDIELQNLAMNIASSGYRDMTRIGGGNPEMNGNLLTSNFSEILSVLPLLKKELEDILTMASTDPDKLNKSLKDINTWRSKLYTKEGKNNLLNKEVETLKL